jgi:hypothetical protein
MDLTLAHGADQAFSTVIGTRAPMRRASVQQQDVRRLDVTEDITS